MPSAQKNSALLQLFPVPKYLAPPVFGLDISDHSVKFIELTRTRGVLTVGRYGSRDLPVGCVVDGKIVQKQGVIDVLGGLKDFGICFVCASLPEEPAYIFTTHVPRVGHDEIRGLLQFKLEENVPLSPAEAVFDYDIVPGGENSSTCDVVVSVFPRSVSQEYSTLLQLAGLVPLSLEIEAQAIARAVVEAHSKQTVLIVDIGRTRSGMSIVSNGIVRFTTTVDVGGDSISEAIRVQYPASSEEEILQIKNEQGCLRGPLGNTLYDAVMPTVQRFADEIVRYQTYWQTHVATHGATTDTRIEKVILTGGNANLAGFSEYLAGRLAIPTQLGNVWVNVVSFDDSIPDIPFNESLGYASAIGLALHEEL